MTIQANNVEIPVYPSPWSVERNIDGVNYETIQETTQDLKNHGLLGYENPYPTGAAFGIASAVELGVGAAVVALGPVGFALQVVKLAAAIGIVASGSIVQYEISPSRHLETNSSDESDIADLMGPGKGDLYYGEGWTLALQTKYRLGIRKNPDNPEEWIPDTAQIFTYVIMERDNQYIYTVRDIEDVVADLALQIADIGDPGDDADKQKEKEKLENAKNTWDTLLTSNPAYIWQKEYIKGTQEASRTNLETFIESNFGEQKGELLIFSGGTTFEYSRTASESGMAEFSTSIDVGTSADAHVTVDAGTIGVGSLGPIAKLELSFGVGAQIGLATTQSYGGSWESGTGVEQTVGFVLSDDDVGDNISTYVLEGPWGTPIFFTDPGSVTSDPYQDGTNKGVDVKLELIEDTATGKLFDYHDGAHYRVLVSYDGKRVLEYATVDFIIYEYPSLNQDNMTAFFNGDRNPYVIALSKTDPTVIVEVSLYPPGIDQDSSSEKEYSVGVEVDSIGNPAQINRILTLKPRFADLRSPRATITAPYDGQRISPEMFLEADDKPFEIEVFSDDYDVAKIQIEKRFLHRHCVASHKDNAFVPELSKSV